VSIHPSATRRSGCSKNGYLDFPWATLEVNVGNNQPNRLEIPRNTENSGTTEIEFMKPLHYPWHRKIFENFCNIVEENQTQWTGKEIRQTSKKSTCT
jgi:hypothetical protein